MAEVAALVASEVLKGTTAVWTEGMDEWLPLAELRRPAERLFTIQIFCFVVGTGLLGTQVATMYGLPAMEPPFREDGAGVGLPSGLIYDMDGTGTPSKEVQILAEGGRAHCGTLAELGAARAPGICRRDS
jgi:hypothetical protein